MTESEIIVIGGGIAGASAALHLARYGHDVTLLESRTIASEASGLNMGGLGGAGWGNSPGLQEHLTMGSLDIFESLALDDGYDIEFRRSGTLQAIQNDEQYEYAWDRMFKMRALGHTMELISTREARVIEPEANPNLLGFLHTPMRGQADPVKATQAFASAAKASGAKIVEGQKVTSIETTSDGYSLSCGAEEHRAKTIVIAAGAWCAPIGEMFGLNIPIVSVKGQMWATEPMPPRVFHTISSSESSLAWDRETASEDYPPDLTHREGRRTTRHLYGRQNALGEIIFGGDRQAVGYDMSIDTNGIEVNKGQATEVLPFLSSLPIGRTWAGLMPFSLDGKPIIGRIDSRPNAYIVSGLASSGFGRGPMAGKLVADFVHSGQMPTVLLESNPNRCITELTI